jgi:GH18 family chitinase
MAIPASYWHPHRSKPTEVEPYVDPFCAMTYDLHRPWDKKIKQISAVVYGQTNVPKILQLVDAAVVRGASTRQS